MKKIIKTFIEKLSGYKVYDISPHKYGLVNSSFDTNNWFSQEGCIRQCLSEREIDIVLDVGANEGQFVKFLREVVGFDGRVISFEPNPVSFEKLNEISQNDELWDVCNFALGNEVGYFDLIVYEVSVLSSFLQPNDGFMREFGHDLGDESRVVKVKMETLEAVLPQMISELSEKNIFLKMDTQGFDLEVYEGLGNMLNNIKMLQSEVSLVPLYDRMPDWKKSLSVFEENGFGVCGLFPVSFTGLKVIEYDCLLEKA